eukprot:g1976.t1
MLGKLSSGQTGGNSNSNAFAPLDLSAVLRELQGIFAASGKGGSAAAQRRAGDHDPLSGGGGAGGALDATGANQQPQQAGARSGGIGMGTTTGNATSSVRGRRGSAQGKSPKQDNIKARGGGAGEDELSPTSNSPNGRDDGSRSTEHKDGDPGSSRDRNKNRSNINRGKNPRNKPSAQQHSRSSLLTCLVQEAVKFNKLLGVIN